MPKVGYGTCYITDVNIMAKAATELGYRMYDCASYYKNEHLVGEAIEKILGTKKVKREELFIVSKVWWDEVHDVEAACLRSIEKLKVKYLDLYLIHWPFAMKKVDG